MASGSGSEQPTANVTVAAPEELAPVAPVLPPDETAAPELAAGAGAGADASAEEFALPATTNASEAQQQQQQQPPQQQLT